MEKSRKIAIACQNASFRMGGEAAIPLRFFKEFRALGHDPLLLTHARVEDELRSILSPSELSRVVFFPDRAIHRWIYKFGKLFPSAPREAFIYPVIAFLCDLEQRKSLKEKIQADEIDLVFQPTPISPKAVSPFYNLGAPVFFGPLNGAMNYPPGFRKQEGEITRFFLSAGRSFANLLHHIIPGKKNAAAIFVSNPRTLENLPSAARNTHARRSFDATIDAERWAGVNQNPEAPPDFFICVGRLADWKAFHLTIKAAHLVGPHAKLTIVGDGPERPRLERIAKEGPAEIRFAGFVPHEELVKLYPGAIAQAHPALREAGGNACLEALAAGAPVIAARWGGAMDVIEDGVDGILIDPIDEEHFIAAMADAMRALLADPERARAMGAAGRARVLSAFGWRQKAQDYCEVFEACLTSPCQGLTDAHPRHRVNGRSINLAWV